MDDNMMLYTTMDDNRMLYTTMEDRGNNAILKDLLCSAMSQA
jgi:hypothetical protein